MAPPTLLRFVPCALALAASACGGDASVGSATSDLIQFEVDHYDGICDGNDSWYCPRVREVGKDQSWRTLPCDIKGLDRKWGHTYVVEVEPMQKEEMLHGCGTLEHHLVEVIIDQPVEAGTSFSYEVGSYELDVFGDGSVSLAFERIECADPAVCSDLVTALDGSNSGQLRLNFEHATPGDKPVLVSFAQTQN